AACGEVVSAKSTLPLPAGTVTLAGTVATEVSLLASDTVKPPAGAALPRLTWALAGSPPVTLVVSTHTALSTRAVPSREALRLAPAGSAVIVRLESLASGEVLTRTRAVILPAGTVTLAGTVATLASLLESGTLKPPGSAGPVRETTPFTP